jgi:hypothetical protein
MKETVMMTADMDTMMNGDGNRALLEELEDLLVRRDQLYKESETYMILYTQEFGDLIVANFELKIECIGKKKAISYCRRRMNRGLAVDVRRMQAELDEEMKLYYVQLQDLIKETNAAKEAETVDEYRSSRSRKIYRRLAKVMHPDINRHAATDEELQELWAKVVHAYQQSDVDELEDLEILVRRAMARLGEEMFLPDCDDLERRIERVECQINDILTTEPYTYGELLRDEEQKAAYRTRLQEEHDDYEQYLHMLEKTLEEMLSGGEAKLVWNMNL